MNTYTIFLVIFFIAAGFVLLGWFSPISAMVAAIAAFACAVLLIVDRG